MSGSSTQHYRSVGSGAALLIGTVGGASECGAVAHRFDDPELVLCRLLEALLNVSTDALKGHSARSMVDAMTILLTCVFDEESDEAEDQVVVVMHNLDVICSCFSCRYPK